MTKALLEWETIDADQITDIMEDRPPRPPKNLPPPSGDTPPGGNSGTEVKPGSATAPA
jgi:cell division protease FtsH